jgi:hypothetical protein
VRRGTVTVAKVGYAIVVDFPKYIPVSPRELDVIETYLGGLLDDALKEREKREMRLGEDAPRCENAPRSSSTSRRSRCCVRATRRTLHAGVDRPPS